eukprot:symbB.v1.2.035737.t1/scaffold4884.1/size33470/1
MCVPWQVFLLSLTTTLAFESGEGFCDDGECINCNYCDGDCFSACKCETELNSCCCTAPRGHYARGYEKVACPGGTYQDQTGQNLCKPCSVDSTVLFDVNYRGAVDLVDCEEAKVRCSSCTNATSCEVQCVSSVAVETAMVSKPTDTAFCVGLTEPIGERGCTWLTVTSWASTWHAEVVLVMLTGLFLRS